MLLGGYDTVRAVTFKKVASLINAAQHLVIELDAQPLSYLDVERFLRDVVWASLSNSKRPNELIESARVRRAVSIWGKDPSDRNDAVLRFLGQQGFSPVATKQQPALVILVELVEKLQRQTPKSVLAWAQSSD